MIPPQYKVIGYTINYVEDDQDQNVAGSLIWSILAICNHTNWFFV